MFGLWKKKTKSLTPSHFMDRKIIYWPNEETKIIITSIFHWLSAYLPPTVGVEVQTNGSIKTILKCGKRKMMDIGSCFYLAVEDGKIVVSDSEDYYSSSLLPDSLTVWELSDPESDCTNIAKTFAINVLTKLTSSGMISIEECVARIKGLAHTMPVNGAGNA